MSNGLYETCAIKELVPLSDVQKTYTVLSISFQNWGHRVVTYE